MVLESSRGELLDWFRPRPNRRSGRKVMMAQSPKNPNRDNFRTPLWESRDKEPLACGRGGATQRTPKKGGEAAAPSIIRIIQKVHGRKVMPPDGGIVRSENVQMQPLFPKGSFYATLNFRVFGWAVKSNSLPSGHTDLHRRHPGLEKNFLKGIFAIEMFSAPFRP